MNRFLPELFIEIVHRLSLGLEPLDATRPSRIARPVVVALDGTPDGTKETPWLDLDPAAGLVRVRRSGSGRYKLVYPAEVDTPVNLRLVPRDRRYVPRRISFPIVNETDVLAAEDAGGSIAAATRIWRPRLFPGASYDVSETATGFRGRVTRGGVPVRWTRVEASANGTVLGRAHGDDRGEFLLLLGTNQANVGDLGPLKVDVRVRAMAPPNVVDPLDPLADLPLEPAAGPGVSPDLVAADTQLPPVTKFPAGYALLDERANVPVRFGRITSLQPFAIP